MLAYQTAQFYSSRLASKILAKARTSHPKHLAQISSCAYSATSIQMAQTQRPVTSDGLSASETTTVQFGSFTWRWQFRSSRECVCVLANSATMRTRADMLAWALCISF